MINNFIYAVVVLILVFVIYLTIKAVGRGLKAKNADEHLKKNKKT